MRLCPWSLSMCNPTPILYTSFKPKMTAGAETPSPEFSRPFGQQIAHPLATWHNKVDSHGFPMEGKRPGSTGGALFAEQLNTLPDLFSKPTLPAVLVAVNDQALPAAEKLQGFVEEDVFGPVLSTSDPLV